jgi:hypothetical protein
MSERERSKRSIGSRCRHARLRACPGAVHNVLSRGIKGGTWFQVVIELREVRGALNKLPGASREQIEPTYKATPSTQRRAGDGDFNSSKMLSQQRQV